MIKNDVEIQLMDFDTTTDENEFLAGVERYIKSASELDSVSFSRWLVAFREKVIVLLLEKGILPPLTLIQLFPLIHKISGGCERDSRLDNHLMVLKKHLADIKKDSYEYFLVLDLLFILEMLNVNPERGLSDYLGAMIKSNIFEADQYPEGKKLFKEIIHICGLTPDEMMDILKSFLDLPYFFHLDFDSQASIMIWILAGIWDDNRYGRTEAFLQLEQPLQRLMVHALSLNRVAFAMQIYNVAHFVLSNLFQSQKEMIHFNEQFTKPISSYYINLAESFPKPEKSLNHKKKIAFVRDRLVYNSTHKVEFTILEALMKDTDFTALYDVYIYSVGHIEIELDNRAIVAEYEKLGVDVRVIPDGWYGRGYYYDHLEKAKIIRSDMFREGIDIMIATVGNNNVIDFLFATRVAPLQIYWSHGNFAYNIEGIDLRITHSDEATALSGIREGFKYQFFFAPYDITALKGNTLEAKIIEERQKYPSDTIILGSIGRIVKLENDAYLEAVAEIMRRNPNTIYLACGSSESAFIQSRLKRLGIEERFYFTGFIDPHLYGHIIDLYLDTFPMGSGEALNEYLAKEKIAVILLPPEHPIICELFMLGKEKSYQRIHAYDHDDYIELADTILNDSDLRNKLLQEAHERVSIHMPNMSQQTVKTFLRSLGGQIK